MTDDQFKEFFEKIDLDQLKMDKEFLVQLRADIYSGKVLTPMEYNSDSRLTGAIHLLDHVGDFMEDTLKMPLKDATIKLETELDCMPGSILSPSETEAEAESAEIKQLKRKLEDMGVRARSAEKIAGLSLPSEAETAAAEPEPELHVNPEIMIELSGGLIARITTAKQIKIVVLDWDNDRDDDQGPPTQLYDKESDTVHGCYPYISYPDAIDPRYIETTAFVIEHPEKFEVKTFNPPSEAEPESAEIKKLKRELEIMELRAKSAEKLAGL